MEKYSYEIMDLSIQAMGMMIQPATDTVEGYFALFFLGILRTFLAKKYTG